MIRIELSENLHLFSVFLFLSAFHNFIRFELDYFILYWAKATAEAEGVVKVQCMFFFSFWFLIPQPKGSGDKAMSYLPFYVFYAYSCPLCNLNTLWNIIMILDSYVEQVTTMCRVQE